MAGHRCHLWYEAVVEAYRAGVSVAQLASEVNTDPLAIYRELKIHGVAHQRGLRAAWAVEAGDRRRAGQTLQEIATAVGVTRERVRQVVNKLGAVSPLTRRWGRPHRCGDACRAVLAAPSPLVFSRVTAATGISRDRLAYAAKVHGVLTQGHEHVCNDLCQRVRVAGRVASTKELMGAIGATAPSMRTHLYRLRRYHPDWPWPRVRRKGKCR